MLFNNMIAAEIYGMSRKVNVLQTVADKLPYGIKWKSSGAHQDRISGTMRLNHD
jgi:hypothetical protein